MELSTKLAIGAAVGVAAYLLVNRTAGAVMDATKDLVTEKLNPVSDKNVIYDGIIGGIGRTVSGDDDWTLGGWIYDVTH